jgi:tetratricopeptide (TPR) repeat protein
VEQPQCDLVVYGTASRRTASSDRAVEINPTYSQAWYNRGRILQTLKQDVDAVVAYDRAINSYGNLSDKLPLADMWANRSVVLWRLQRYGEALASTNQAIDLNPASFQAWYNQGIILLALKQYDQAVSAYEQAISINPNDANLFAAKGLALIKIKRLPEALATFEQALKIDPSNQRCRGSLLLKLHP